MVVELPTRGVTWKDDDRTATIDLTLEAGSDMSPRVFNVAQNRLSPPPPSQPSFNRRHSFHPVGSKPLRSSPLAGPALSSEGSTLKPPTDERLPRMSSNPDLGFTITPPPPARHARPKSSQGFETPEAGPSSPPTSPTSPTFGGAALPDSPSRHSFFLGLEKRRSKRLSVSSPLEVPPVACPPVPEWALQQRSTNIGSQRRPRSSHADLERNRFAKPRPMSTHGYPVPNDNSSLLSVPVPHTPGASSPRESGSSWLTANTYETTPRFSRLGLAASNVVLPVSAREHRRLSKTSSNSSICSASTVTGSRSRNGATSPTSSLSRSSSSSYGSITSSPSTPALSLTRSSSASSSDESLHPPSVIPGSNTTSSLSLDITTIAEDDEEQASQFAEPHHIRTFSISSIRKGTLSRMTSFRHSLRASRSYNDVHFVPEYGPDEEANKVPNEHVRKDAMDITVSVTELPLDGDKVTAALNEHGVSRKHGTIRRLWKTISGTRWGRASR